MHVWLWAMHGDVVCIYDTGMCVHMHACMCMLSIIVSAPSYSTKFLNLIGKKNPLAILATVILLSYAKLL